MRFTEFAFTTRSGPHTPRLVQACNTGFPFRFAVLAVLVGLLTVRAVYGGNTTFAPSSGEASINVLPAPLPTMMTSNPTVGRYCRWIPHAFGGSERAKHKRSGG